MLKFFNDLVKKVTGNAPETKSLSHSEIIQRLRYGTGYSLDGCSDYFLNPSEAYYYFENVSPLQSTVKRIAQTVSHLPLAIVSESNPDEMVTDHEIIHILQSPGYGLTEHDLLLEICISFLLTEEAWIVLRGRINAPPVSISVLRAYEVSPEGSYSEYYPDFIRTDSDKETGQRYFYPVRIEGVMRYFDTETGTGALNELVPVIGVKAKNRVFRGLSRLMSLQRPLMQIISGDIYNTKLLKGGAKPWMVLSPKADEGLSELEMEDIETSLEQLKGAQNVGGIFVLPSSMDNVSKQTTHRDLEYQALLSEVKQRVADAYYVPLVLISPDAMTYNNYSIGQVAFYDGPVSNLVNNLFPHIVKILGIRTGNTEKLRMTFNEYSVPALQMRQAERMDRIAKTGTTSLNENREIIGYDPVPLGEEIYMPGNLVPVSVPGTTGDDF